MYSKNDLVMALSEGNDEPERIALEDINVSGAEVLKFPEEASTLPVTFQLFGDLFNLKVGRL